MSCDECGPHGKCKPVRGEYKCVCNDGWSGKNCLIPCPPCDDGKQCNTSSGKCECPNNSWGLNCKNPACGGSPCGDHQMCQNKGCRCAQEGGGWVPCDCCVCAGGWWDQAGGSLCSYQPSPCDTRYKYPFDPKKATPSDYMKASWYTFCNGQTRGKCNSNLTCDCTLGWSGVQCEKPPSCKDWVPQRLSLSMNNISMAMLEALRKNDKTNFDKACKEINKTTPNSLLKDCQSVITQCEDDLKTICEKPDSFTTEAKSWLDGLKKTCSSPPPPQTTKYSCDSKTGLCKVSASGSFSDKSKCQDACKKPSPHKSLVWLWILLGVFGALILVGIVIVYSTRSR